MSQSLLKIIHLNTGNEIFNKVRTADQVISRMIGLLDRSSLQDQEGLWIKPCSSIHMWGMRFPIDAIFLKGTIVLKVEENLRPWSFFPVFAMGATSVLEVKAGMVQKYQIKKGDELCFDSSL